VVWAGDALNNIYQAVKNRFNDGDADDCPEYKPTTRDRAEDKMGGEDNDPFAGSEVVPEIRARGEWHSFSP
jgi:hypothetical protein